MTPSAPRERGPTVSVIMPFLDCAPFLEEAIRSVSAQTYGDWELLLVDDGSSDGSEAVAASFARRDPARIRLLAHPGRENRGASAARNLGLRHARGRYVAFLDGDDVWLPHKLEEQVALLEADPGAGMLYGRTLHWYSWTGRPEDRDRDHVPDLGVPTGVPLEPPELLTRVLTYRAPMPCTCSTLVRRDLLERVGGFEEHFRRVYTDQALYTKLLLHAPVLVADGCWDRYRQHPGSASALRRSEERTAARVAFLEWVGKYLEEEGADDPRVWRALSRALWPHRHPRLYRLLRPGFRLRSAASRWLRALRSRTRPS